MNDIDNSQLTKQQQKKTVNEKRRSYTKAILGAEHFTEALRYKLALEAEGVPVDSNIYYELFFRCTDYQTVCELKEEIMSNGCSLDERTYQCLLKRMSSSAERLTILREMESNGIKITVKTYFILIKRAENIEEALALFNEMKARDICTDVRIYWELIRLAQGTEYIAKIKHEMANFEQLKALAAKADTYAYIQFSLRKAKQWGLEYDVEFFNDMFFYLDKPEDMVSLLTLIEHEGFSYSYRTYLAFLQAYIDKGGIDDIQIHRKRIEASLCPIEYAKLFAWYKQGAVIKGGLGKVNIKVYQQIEKLKQDIMHQEDFSHNFFKLGVIDGLESEGTDFIQGIEDVLDEIEMLEVDLVADPELFINSIEFQRGRIEGIKKRQEIYCDIRDKHLPMLIIAYVTDEEALVLLRKQAFLSNLYEYDIGNIATHRVNGFLFTSSLREFQTIISHVPFDNYDVAIGIMDGEDSLNFADDAPKLGRYLYSLQFDSFDKVGFYSWKSNRKNDPQILLAKLYSGVVIKSMKLKKSSKVKYCNDVT